MANSAKGTEEDDLDIIGASPTIRALRSQIRRVATTNAPVLVIGETGTGKELVARAVHRLSDRSSGPLVCVNCGALNSELLESELFGHEKGSFTGAITQRKGKFEAATGGILFLDEINSTGLDFQVKLLRVVQDKIVTPMGSNSSISVDVRIVAASNQSLEEKVRTGQFREDLFYRLNVVPINVPALRDRQGDVVMLAEHFMRRYCEEDKREFLGLSEDARIALVSHVWPGNVRELENVMRRAIVLAERSGPEIPLDVSPAFVAPSPLAGNCESTDGIADRVFDALLRGQRPLEGMLKGDTEMGETADFVMRGIEAGLEMFLASSAGQEFLSHNVKRAVLLDRMGLSPRKSGNESQFGGQLRLAVSNAYERHALD